MNAATPDMADSGDSAAARVLVVEDDSLLRRGVERMLVAAGYSVSCAASGLEALPLVDQLGPDAVVSDVSMPGMGGVELLRAVAGRDEDIPVILITGVPSLDSAIEAVEFGAFHYLTKPFKPEQLLELVRRAVHTRRLARLQRQALALAGLPGGLTRDLQGLQAAFERVIEAFHIDYQPVVQANGGAIYGYEALLRSNEPSLPHPGAVLAAAERLGRVCELGRAIRARVAHCLLQHPELGHLFVNVHPLELADDELLDELSPLTQVADRVIIEITERTALDGVPDLRHRVQRLRSLGYRIAVDDLGAGYAGLSSFAILQPEIVKIDMSLIRGVHREPVRQKLVRSMTRTCLEMGVLVVAEGIETVQERDAVLGLGCNLMQGFLLGRPGPLRERRGRS